MFRLHSRCFQSPENAVGSYVKIVQRVPVKIVFTEDISGYNIVPGMSVVPEVKVK